MRELHKKVLACCSANQLRSPTIAWTLSNPPYNYNTRSCGTYGEALIPITRLLIEWADEIVCAEQEHADYIKKKFGEWKVTESIKVLRIPDTFEYREPILVSMIRYRYDELTEKPK